MLKIRIDMGSYGAAPVLRAVELAVAPGQIHGLIGPNGSGKTSLLRAISGVLPQVEGEVQLGDLDLQALSTRERARHLAVVPQVAPLPAAFTVWEVVSLGRTPHLNWLGQLGAKDEARIEWALQATALEDFRDQRVGRLSGGEQQRVLLARALAQDCPALLLDEPTAHLDLHHQVAFLDLVARMAADQRLAVLIALHDLNLAALYADQLSLLFEGQLQVSGSPRQVLTSAHLEAAFNVPVRVEAHPENGRPRLLVEPASSNR